jgi:hypothetical protein
MQNPVSRPTKLDTLRAAIASTGGQTALLQTLLEELEATRAERDALRQEKHGDKLEIERLVTFHRLGASIFRHLEAIKRLVLDASIWWHDQLLFTSFFSSLTSIVVGPSLGLR